jgi:glutamyl-Q tRNA(Asp) synthetase
LRTSDTPICFTDRCAGTVCQNIRRLYGDFALQRGDGGFTYQLAVVVDDQITGVNQVVRGRDLLDSTGRQIYLQQQLGVLHPLYAHLPLVTGRDGGKLSKRDNLVSEQLHNWHGRESLLLADILRFFGMNVPDELKLLRCDEILQWGVLHFDAAHIPDKNSTLEYVQG